MQSGEIKLSSFDFMAGFLKRGSADLTNASDSAVSSSPLLLENRELLLLLTTSVAVLIACVFVFVWRRSNHKSSKSFEPVKFVRPKVEPEDEQVDDHGNKKVTIFFGTQTGTAEGFAKVCFVLSIHPYYATVNYFNYLPLLRTCLYAVSCLF